MNSNTSVISAHQTDTPQSTTSANSALFIQPDVAADIHVNSLHSNATPSPSLTNDRHAVHVKDDSYSVSETQLRRRTLPLANDIIKQARDSISISITQTTTSDSSPSADDDTVPSTADIGNFSTGEHNSTSNPEARVVEPRRDSVQSSLSQDSEADQQNLSEFLELMKRVDMKYTAEEQVWKFRNFLEMSTNDLSIFFSVFRYNGMQLIYHRLHHQAQQYPLLSLKL